MGKPADFQDTADRSRSWARSLTWAKPTKHSTASSKSELPTTEPRVANANDGSYNPNTAAHPVASDPERKGSNTSKHSNGNENPVASSPTDATSSSRPAAAPPPVDTE